MADQYKVVYCLANDTIVNERPQTQILSSGHSLKLNTPEKAKNTAIVTMECE